MKTVAIIIPVYNAEKKLKACIKSITKQTYKNFKCILVDDGSKDNSGKICDQAAAKDNRFVVIHKKNAGAFEARKTGIFSEDAQSCDYVTFVDADDALPKNGLEIMAQKMENAKCDLVAARFSRIWKTDVVQLQPGGELLQAAGLVFLTDGAVPAVRRQQQLQDHPSVMLQPWRVCFDDHAVFGRSGAGSDQAAPLVLHHTHAARAVNGKIGIIAQGGNVDAHAVDHLENVLFLVKIRPDAVDNHIFSHSFFSLTVVMPVSGFQLIAWNGQPSLHAPHLIHLPFTNT